MSKTDARHLTAFGTALHQLRDSRGLSQSQLAALASVNVRTLQQWEQGRREPAGGAVLRLARALDVTADALLAPLVDGKTPKRSDP